jgi:hypothetical protein
MCESQKDHKGRIMISKSDSLPSKLIERVNKAHPLERFMDELSPLKGKDHGVSKVFSLSS